MFSLLTLSMSLFAGNHRYYTHGKNKKVDPDKYIYHIGVDKKWPKAIAQNIERCLLLLLRKLKNG